MKKLKILVADDHQIVRRGVAGAVQDAHPEWEVCGEAANGREAVLSAIKLKPDVVVMDISMPELNGLEATRRILKELPETQVLILSVHESEQIVRDVLSSGARGYVLKSDAGTDLVAAIEALSQRKLYFTSKVSEFVLSGFLKTSAPDFKAYADGGPLSPREREIVQLIAEGHANKGVADVLHISVKTVETHRARIMEKLGAHSVSDLVRYAIRNGLVQC
jgi:DNA-binding NarL/FixJ family response regulator